MQFWWRLSLKGSKQGRQERRDQYSKSAFHSAQNLGKLQLEVKWNGPFRLSSTRTVLGPPLKVAHFDRSAHFGLTKTRETPGSGDS